MTGQQSTDDDEFAQRIIADGWLPDPWLQGRLRLAPQPASLTEEEAAALCDAAEAVAEACDELCRILAQRSELLVPLGLLAVQEALWWSSAPHWHGLARADVFRTRDGGLQVCEINCDTPSGIAEAVVLGRLTTRPPARDANASLLARWVALLHHAAQQQLHPAPQLGEPLTIGILAPTEHTEDLPMQLLWRHALQEHGWRVVDGSPFNLSLAADGRAALLGVPCDVMVRHYKTDWWAERRSVWRDEPPVPDDEPLLGPLRVLVGAQVAGRTAVVNPMGAIVPQNKRFFALLHRHIDLLTPKSQAAVAQFVPVTYLLEALDAVQLAAEQAQWVLKSDYGAEGAEVIVGAEVDAAVWQSSLDQAVPGRWVAQRWFDAARNPAGEQVNWGVYLIAGASAGLLARQSTLATDERAVMAAVQLLPGAADG